SRRPPPRPTSSPYTTLFRPRAARVHRCELRPIAHEQHFRADLLGVTGDGIERERATQGGFVDDDELSAREVPFPEAMLMQPLRRSEEHTSELQSRFDLVCRL